MRAIGGVGGRSGGAAPAGRKSHVRASVSAGRPGGWPGITGGISIPNIGPIGVF